MIFLTTPYKGALPRFLTVVDLLSYLETSVTTIVSDRKFSGSEGKLMISFKAQTRYVSTPL